MMTLNTSIKGMKCDDGMKEITSNLLAGQVDWTKIPTEVDLCY